MTTETMTVTKKQWLLVDFYENPAYVQRALKGMHEYQQGVQGISFEDLLEDRQVHLNGGVNLNSA